MKYKDLELTPENMIYVMMEIIHDKPSLVSRTPEFNINNYSHIMTELLNAFYINKTLNFSSKSEIVNVGGICRITNKNIDCVHEDVYKISITDFYYKETVNLLVRNQIRFNVEEVQFIYCLLYQTRKLAIEQDLLDIAYLCKYMMNASFGATYSKSDYYLDKPSLIVENTRSIMLQLISRYDSIIYVDTDRLLVKGTKELDKIMLSINAENHNCIVSEKPMKVDLIDTGRYITIDSYGIAKEHGRIPFGKRKIIKS